MTPADRDIARSRAQAIVDGAPCTDVEEVFARYILRYVPAGDAEHRGVRPLRVDHDLPPVFRHIVAIGNLSLQPDHARAVAHALHAAADAAEETTR